MSFGFISEFLLKTGFWKIKDNSNIIMNRDCKYEHFRNSDIKSVTMGIPNGHRHLRTIIKTEKGNFVFQEATIAAIVRAYTTIKTHPQKKGIRLIGQETPDRKKGYAPYQLVETDEISDKITGEMGNNFNRLD